MFNCSCCGTDVTSPYFHNGGVYGYTCIKKVNPSTKRNKPKSKCVEVEVLKILDFSENSSRSSAKVEINGVSSIVSVYREYLGDGVFSNFIEISNFSFYDGRWWAFI